MRFNGPEYRPEHDRVRLSIQHLEIKNLMLDGKWRTLSEIEKITGFPHASISAQLRHLRKERFGSYTVERRPRKDRAKGLFEYRLIEPTGQVTMELKKKKRCPHCGEEL